MATGCGDRTGHAGCESACPARPSLPPRTWTLRVEDILESIEKIGRFTKDMSFEDSEGDERTVDAVVRNISVISKAASHVPEEIRKRHPNVPRSGMRA